MTSAAEARRYGVAVLPHDEAGSGQAVVLLHAGVGDRGMWREHLDWLASAGFRAIAVDLPGFGEAPVAPGAQAPWEDVLQTLRELEAAPAVLVGNSFGAAVALRCAVVAPVAVSSLVLISPPPIQQEPSPTLAKAWEAEEAAWEAGDTDRVVTAVVEAWLAPDAPLELKERVATMQRRAVEVQMSAPEPEEAPDPVETNPDLVKGLKIPVLAAAGESDMSDFKDGAQELARLAPHAELATIHGAGHLAPLEAPDEFRELVLGFLRRAG
ncbi:MAG: alpha/beta fold hydrolase [Solirubrobacteraceae bacterium]